MSDKLERVMSVVLTAAAVVFASILVKREFFDDPRGQANQELRPPERVANWNELRANGLALKDSSAPVVVVEFADLECPACKQFNTRLKVLQEETHTKIGLVFVHYPLSMHRFARPAARALECANSQGAAAQFVDLAYSKQDSFGLKSWVGYAKEAGVRDTVAFALCAADTARIERIEAGRRLGESLKLQGTPLIVVNGWRFASVPSDEEFRKTIEAFLHGQSPPSARAVGKFRLPFSGPR